MKRPSSPTIFLAMALLGAASGVALATQDRYTVKGPDGLSFSEFKGYQTWQTVAVSQVKEGLKVISANAVMMDAYRRGLPAAGKEFPEGSKIVKIEWSQKQNTASPYFVMVPDKLMSVSFIEKDSKRFPSTHGWAYAQFLYDPATGAFKANGAGHECGYACHTAEASRDYIFTDYPER